jgi:hypothetical protein
MKRFVEGEDRLQVALLPHCLDDYVTENNGTVCLTRGNAGELCRDDAIATHSVIPGAGRRRP